VLVTEEQRYTARLSAWPSYRQLLPRIALIVGLALVVVGVALNWRLVRGRGEDFGDFWVLARSIARGFDLYAAADLPAAYRDIAGTDTFAPWGIFNMPATGIAMLPFALLPLGIARTIWFALTCAVLLVGVHQLLRLLLPRLRAEYRVLILGAVMCASSVRWGLLYLQTAPLIFGLLCLFVVELVQRRRITALVLAVAAVCLKFTLGLPFVGLALVQRRYGLAAAVVGVWLLANGVGFARVGGLDAIRGYQQNMTRFEQADQVNYPDFRAPTSMQRLDWPYLLNAINPDLPRSDALGMLLAAVSGAYLLRQWHRVRGFARETRTMLAFLGPVVCVSLLSVYHHHYDAIALLAPAVVYLSQTSKYDWRLVALFVIPVVAFAGLYPVEQTQLLVDRLFGDGAWLYLKLLGVIILDIAFVASLLLLRSFVATGAASLEKKRLTVW
jgi:hypothetical protein